MVVLNFIGLYSYTDENPILYPLPYCHKTFSVCSLSDQSKNSVFELGVCNFRSLGWVREVVCEIKKGGGPNGSPQERMGSLEIGSSPLVIRLKWLVVGDVQLMEWKY